MAARDGHALSVAPWSNQRFANRGSEAPPAHARSALVLRILAGQFRTTGESESGAVLVRAGAGDRERAASRRDAQALQEPVKLALVVHRYGADIAGGSEAETREYAERLAVTHDVTVLTSCARDYVT